MSETRLIVPALVLLAATSCGTAAGDRFARGLARPAERAAELLAPGRLAERGARRLRHARDDARRFARRPVERAYRLERSLRRPAWREPSFAGDLQDGTETLAGMALDDVRALRRATAPGDLRGRTLLSPGRRARRLTDRLRRAGSTLRLDDPPMGEPGDFERQTDPHARPVPMSAPERVLRRLGW